MTRTKAVEKRIRWIKAIHVLMTLIWPVIAALAVSGISFLHRTYQKNDASYYNWLGTVLLICWLFYVYYMMILIRNFNLQVIAMQECDFDAYLECVRYLEKFQLPGAKRSQRINSTDAYLLVGDFEAAYRHLMRLKPEYERCGNRARMMYDYFWCRFYAELEDAQNTYICKDAFRNNWIRNPQVRRGLRKQAVSLLHELDFRDILYTGKNDKIKKDMINLYLTGMLGSRYEFVRYCYYMGRLEYNRNNLQVAKHWFAQTVSFGLQEYMSKRAADFLEMLDYMQVPYAAVPPAENQYYSRERHFNMASGLISILLGLFLVLAVIFYG